MYDEWSLIDVMFDSFVDIHFSHEYIFPLRWAFYLDFFADNPGSKSLKCCQSCVES